MSNQSKTYIIESDKEYFDFIKRVWLEYQKHGFLEFKHPKTQRGRALTQNGLLHVWCREYLDFLAENFVDIQINGVTITSDDVIKSDINDLKRALKIRFYEETRESWIVRKKYNVLNGQSGNDVTSSTEWTWVQCFDFLTWFQGHAAAQGCVLISKGVYERLQAQYMAENHCA